MTADDLPEFPRVPEVAKFLGLSEPTIWRMVSLGELPSVRLSKRTVSIRKRDLLSWLDQRESASLVRR